MSNDKQDQQPDRLEDLEVEGEAAAEVAGGTTPATTQSNIAKTKHDAAMAAIQNTR